MPQPDTVSDASLLFSQVEEFQSQSSQNTENLIYLTLSLKIREYCSTCSLPKKVCLCKYLPETPIHSDIKVEVVQHPLESKISARSDFITKRIVSSVKITRSRKFPDFPVDSVLLFPSKDSLDLAEYLDSLLRDGKPLPSTLIVPDGTWQFTKEMVSKLESEEDRKFQAVHLTLPAAYRGAFVIRKPPQEGWVCTGEAIAIALDLIDKKSGCASGERFTPAIRKALAAYSAQQLAFAKGKAVHHRDKPQYLPGLYEDLQMDPSP